MHPLIRTQRECLQVVTRAVGITTTVGVTASVLCFNEILYKRFELKTNLYKFLTRYFTITNFIV